ncbi:phage tail length tape measure family protein [Dyella sp.]|uniref:phage tail length tape measure family protein n=1 Tax=Dyella sp. TaxID=1869338 RepID=UPI003F80746F
MISENTLRLKMEIVGNGDVKVSLGETEVGILKVDQAQQGAAQSAQASAEAQKANAAATQAAGEAAGEAEARIKAMVQASLARAEAERAAAEATQRATSTQASATVGLGRLVEAQNRAMAGATRMVQAEQQQAAAAARTAGIEAQREELGKLVGQIDPTIAALEKLDQQQDKLNQFRQAGVIGLDDYKRFSAVIDESRVRINAAGEAMSHFTLNSSGARREVGVLIGELAQGNFSNFEGSLATLANRTGLLSALLSPLSLGIAGVAAEIGVLAKAAYDEYAQQQRLNEAIATTGNYAGVTQGQVLQMATAIGGSTNRIGEARDILTDLVATGKVGGTALASLGQAAFDMAELTGKSAEQATQAVVSMFDGTAAGAVKANEQYHFLTEATYEQIKALEEQGKQEEAVRVEAEAFHNAIGPRIEDMKNQVYGLAAAWESTKAATRGWWQEVQNGASLLLGTASDAAQVAAMERRKADAQYFVPGGEAGAYGPSPWSAADESKLQALKDKIRLAEEKAATIAADQQRNADAIQADSQVDRLAASVDKLSAKKQAMDQLTASFEKLWASADPDNARLKGVQRIVNADGSATFSGGLFDTLKAGIDKKFQAPGAASLDSASLQAMVDGYRNAQKQIDDVFTNSSRELQGQERAGLIDETDYYHQRIALIGDHAKQLDASLAKEADALRQRKASGAEQVRIEQQLADVEAKRRAAEADAASARKQADNDHLTAQRKLLEINEQINLSLQTYARSRDQSASRQVDAIGHGSDYSQQAQILDQLRAQADSRRDELTKQYRKQGGLDSPEYLQGLQAIDTWEQQQATREAGYWQQRKDAMGNWANGARAALEDFKSHADDVAGTVRDGFAGMFGGMEDAAVAWASGSHVSLKSVEQDFEKTLARMVVQALEAQAISGLLSLVGGAPTAFAGGGAGYSSASGGLGAYGGLDNGSFSGGFSLAGHADGGRIRGPGTGTSDSVLARLSDGENVITAKATNYYGQRFMDDVNSMRLPRFADGGRVGGSAAGSSSGGDMAPIVNIYGAENGGRADARKDPTGRWVIDAFINAAADDVARGGRLGQAVNAATGTRRPGRSYATAGG